MNLLTKSINNLSLLLLWLVIGTGLRLTNLTAKPPWTDEFSTLVFSLGNSFESVPLNKAIALDVLLQPLQPNGDAGVKQVIQHLLTESNHPPLYFILAHWWMQLWQLDTGLVSLWGARSLSALLGAASIPAIYFLSWLAFRSRLISHLAAAMIAVSPYGIFLAQEARHYTLAILWVIASLSFLVIATRYIQVSKALPVWIIVTWIAVNFLGISTHYFFSLTLCAEAIVLLVIAVRQTQNKIISRVPWQQICIVAAGTIVGGLVWLPVFLQSSNAEELTQWIQSGDRSGFAWLNPIFQAAAAWITMLSLLPVEASALPVVIASGGVMIIFFVWALPIFYRGWKTLLRQRDPLMCQVFVGVICSAIALFFIITYAFGIDLTRGARYNFVYFPAVMVLVGASLAVCWNSQRRGERQEEPVRCGGFPRCSNWRARGKRQETRAPFFQSKFYLSTGKKAVIIIWLMGLVSGITVVNNLGYQKYYRPDLLVQLIQNNYQVPILIATTHQTHVQTGEMMGIAREFKLSATNSPLFFLAHQDQSKPSIVLQTTLNQLPRPLDLWLVNFYAPVEVISCIADSQSLPAVDGYNYQLYHCQ